MTLLRGLAAAAALALASALASGLASPSVAGQTVESGESTSLLVRPELLSLTALTHRFPQAATLAPPRLRTVVGSAYPYVAPLVEATVDGGGVRMFLVGQEFQTSLSQETLIQAGVAGTVGRLRAGAAVRGTLAQTGSTDLSISGTTLSERESATSFWTNHIEFAVGLGIGDPDGPAFLDLVLETYRETFEIESLDRDSGNERFGSSFTDADPVFRGSVAVRAGTRGPGRSALRYWAEFQDRSQEARHERTVESITESFRFEDYGHRWATGVSVVAPSGESRIHGFVFYENRVGPADYRTYAYSRYLVDRELSRSEEVWFGGAIERPLPADMTLLAGLQGQFSVAKDETFRLESDLDSTTDARTAENLAQQFSWGVRRSFQDIDLTGTMRTDLALSDLFFNLDVAIRL